MRDRRQKAINYLKKKKPRATQSKSSNDEDIQPTELEKNNFSVKQDADLVAEEENIKNNISKEIKPKRKPKTRRKQRKDNSTGNHQIEIYLSEKENKNINMTASSIKKTTTNIMRKVSDITDTSLAETKLSQETKTISNSICLQSPNAIFNSCPLSRRESLSEIKSNKLNFSEFKMEEINLEYQKPLNRGNGGSGENIFKFLSFSEEIRKIFSSYLQNYTSEEVEEIFNMDKNIYEEQENLNSSRNPNYFLHHQNLNSSMRSILLDWIIEVCGQLSFKRSTFHSSIVLIDIFLSKAENLPINLLQLTGITCLIIAAKNEEITIPSFEAFSHSTDYAYSVPEILNFERKVLETLKWRINYPNLAFWSNFITLKWDKFADEFPTNHSRDFSTRFTRNLILPKFRGHTEESYFLFRNFFQLIDLISLDYESLQYSEKLIVASVNYILIGLYFRCFSISEVVNEFTRNVHACSNYFELNDIYNRFISNFLNIEFSEMGAHIIYVSFFFYMKFEYNLPSAFSDMEGQRRNVRIINDILISI